jgi:hypothetical protein
MGHVSDWVGLIWHFASMVMGAIKVRRASRTTRIPR